MHCQRYALRQMFNYYYYMQVRVLNLFFNDFRSVFINFQIDCYDNDLLSVLVVSWMSVLLSDLHLLV